MDSCVSYLERTALNLELRDGVCARLYLTCACDHGQALSLLEPWVLSHRTFARIKEADVHKKHIVICKMVYTC